MRFEKFNINPKRIKACDCVVRAIGLALDKTWDEVFKALSDIGFKMKRMPNEKAVYEKYLEQQGWTKHKQPRLMDGGKLTVDQFASTFELAGLKKSDYKKIIITVANHMTCIEWAGYEMQLLDTWDCSRKSVGNYWTKDN